MKKRKRKTLAECFWPKVIKNDGCWEWTGSKTGPGYGKMGRRDEDGKWYCLMAHRASYEVNIGKIPENMDIDHLCKNKGCVNPAHLEPVSHLENLRRAENTIISKNLSKMHCPKGHVYDGKGGRRCKTCPREAARMRRLEKA